MVCGKLKLIFACLKIHFLLDFLINRLPVPKKVHVFILPFPNISRSVIDMFHVYIFQSPECLRILLTPDLSQLRTQRSPYHPGDNNKKYHCL